MTFTQYEKQKHQLDQFDITIEDHDEANRLRVKMSYKHIAPIEIQYSATLSYLATSDSTTEPSSFNSATGVIKYSQHRDIKIIIDNEPLRIIGEIIEIDDKMDAIMPMSANFFPGDFVPFPFDPGLISHYVSEHIDNLIFDGEITPTL